MALISQIRKNSWILVVLIALGLIGFIVMDMTSGQQSLFGSSQLIMGEVGDETFDWNQFNRAETMLYGNSAGDVYARRDALWNFYVEQAIIHQEAEEVGLGVSRTELLDLQFGPSPSPVIQQRFRDPNTQMLDRQRLNDFKTAIESGQLTDPNLRAFWAHQEKEIIKERLQSKLGAMVTKAMYTPTWMAEMGYRENNQRITFAYVKVPFDEVENTEVSLADSDFEQYLRENRALFEVEEENRVVEYVAFDVQPTAADSAELRAEIEALIPEFETTGDDSLFAARNLGLYDPAYVTREEISPNIADSVFSMPVGSVYGPYLDGRFYRAVKVIDRQVIPDSVRSRHILVPASDQISLMQAQLRIDSLKTLIETGQERFDSLATRFGSDATRTKGGDLGYAGPGQMVKPFNDLIFFQAEEGKLYTVITQFGVHLVEVTGRKFINNNEGVKLAYLQETIVPSEETQNAAYEQAFSFIGNNKEIEQLRQTVSNEPGLSLETAPMFTRNSFIVGDLGSGQASRDLVRWAFNAKKGEVSPEVYTYQDPVDFYNNKYIVAGLKEVIKPGLPPVAAVRDQIEPLVTNLKKGALIADRVDEMDLSAIAAQYNTQVDTISSVTFSQPVIPELGQEPKVIGTAFALEQGAVSKPVIGSTGVYVLKVINKPEVGTATNLPEVRRTMSTTARSQVAFQLMEAMRKNVDIEDNRSRFY